MRKKKVLAAGGLAATIAAGAVAGALAFAVPAVAEGTTGPAPAPVHRPDGPGHVHRMPVLEVAAEKLGMSREQLAEELRQGKTIADVAREKNVDPQEIIDAMVAKANERIDQAVEAGKLDPERAAKLKQRLPERIAQLVHHGKRPGHFPGEHRREASVPA